MNVNSRYVVSCALADEKKLVDAIGAAFDRKLGLSKNVSLLNGHRPQVLDHIWFNLTKADGLYIELRRNCDVEGRLELPSFPDHQLILFTRVNEAYAVANGADVNQVQMHAAACIGRLPYDVILVDHPA
jgi:hypothetical protein